MRAATNGTGGGYGIWFDATVTGTGNFVQNNIAFGNANATGILIQPAGTTSNHNLCDVVSSGCTVSGNPLFVNASTLDFHLQASSPAINQGITIASVTTDYDGVIRPQGVAYDMGAFEFAAGGSDVTPPTAPSGLIATANSSTTVPMSWTASTDNVGVTGYKIERCIGGSPCTVFAQIATSVLTSFTDTGLTANTVYWYRVRATDAAGNLSGYSNTDPATTFVDTTAPATPTGVRVF